VATPEVVDAAAKWTTLAVEIDTRITQPANEQLARRGGTGKEAVIAATRKTYSEYEPRIQAPQNDVIDAMRRDASIKLPSARHSKEEPLLRGSRWLSEFAPHAARDTPA
jgi:hypothetical protein